MWSYLYQDASKKEIHWNTRTGLTCHYKNQDHYIPQISHQRYHWTCYHVFYPLKVNRFDHLCTWNLHRGSSIVHHPPRYSPEKRWNKKKQKDDLSEVVWGHRPSAFDAPLHANQPTAEYISVKTITFNCSHLKSVPQTTSAISVSLAFLKDVYICVLPFDIFTAWWFLRLRMKCCCDNFEHCDSFTGKPLLIRKLNLNKISIQKLGVAVFKHRWYRVHCTVLFN